MADWPVGAVARVIEDDTAIPAYGLQITNPASANVKGAWLQYVAALACDVSMVLMQTNINNQKGLVDIGIGAAGSEIVVFPNLQVGALAGQLNNTYAIPLSIRKGMRVALRIQAPGTTPNCLTKLQFLAGGFAQVPPPQRWQDWGAVTGGASQGTGVTTGASNVKGTPAQLIAASAFTTRWVMTSIQAIGSVVVIAVDLMVGTQVVIPNMLATNQPAQQIMCFPFTIPKGSQVQARAASTSAAVTLAVQAWGGA